MSKMLNILLHGVIGIWELLIFFVIPCIVLALIITISRSIRNRKKSNICGGCETPNLPNNRFCKNCGMLLRHF